MTTPDDDAAERGARFLGKLLARDPKELDVADDAEVDRQMDAAGVKVGAVPGLDELVARAEAKAAGASDVRTKQAAASGPNVQAVAEGSRPNVQEAATASGPKVLAVANAPASSPKVAAMRSSGPRATLPPPRARWTAVNVAAAMAVAAVAVGVLVTNRRGLFGPGEGEGIRPDEWSQGRTSAGPTGTATSAGTATSTATAGPSATAPATPEEMAARAKELRAAAKAACDAKKWHACGAALDDAAALDPAGEDTPEVIKLRHQVFAGVTSKGDPIK